MTFLRMELCSFRMAAVRFRRGWQMVTFMTSDYYTLMAVLKTQRFPMERGY